MVYFENLCPVWAPCIFLHYSSQHLTAVCGNQGLIAADYYISAHIFSFSKPFKLLISLSSKTHIFSSQQLGLSGVLAALVLIIKHATVAALVTVGELSTNNLSQLPEYWRCKFLIPRMNTT